MKILINREEQDTTSENLFLLLQENSFLDKKGFAVALNNTVIPKSDWEKTKLSENDNILIITATQGG